MLTGAVVPGSGTLFTHPLVTLTDGGFAESAKPGRAKVVPASAVADSAASSRVLMTTGFDVGRAESCRRRYVARMADAAALDLPAFDPTDVTLQGDRFHDVMAELAASAWLARIPLGYLTLDREAGEFFLRTKSATFPGQMIAELFGVGPGPLREEIDNNILHLDGDRHRRLCNVLNPFFTPKAADRWRPTMRQLIADISADVIPAGRCEFVSAVAQHYPAQVIATVMGAPVGDAPRLHVWSHWMQSQFDGPALLDDRDRIEQ